MSPVTWKQVKSILSDASKLAAPERLPWLACRVGLDEKVRYEAERLLQQELASMAVVSDGSVGLATGAETRLLRPGDRAINRFEILFFLGSGGMGEVYAAFDNQLREVIALKTLRSDLANREPYARRLNKEVQIARRLRHENLCRVYDIHRLALANGEAAAVSMELLHGETLLQRIQASEVPLQEAKSIIEQLVSGLQAIHGANILHRDMKSGNVILIRERDSLARAVITDFGLAIDTQAPLESITQFGPNAIVGTPPYMAPELLRGGGASIATDVYALGVVAFELVTGRRPFEGDTALAVALKRLNQRVPSARAFRSDLPRGWEMAIQCCLAEDPLHRPEDPEEFLSILNGGAGTMRAFARRYARRTWIAAAGAAVVGSVMVWRPWEAKPMQRHPAQAVSSFRKGEVFAQRRTEEDINSAIGEFESAVKEDPGYAEAWARLAGSYCAAIHYDFLKPAVARKGAEAAARRALALNPNMGLAQGALAYLKFTDLRTWRAAEPDFQSAIRLDPDEPECHAWYAVFLGRSGRFEKAIAQANTAVSLAPGPFYFSHQLAAELFRAREFKRFLRQGLELVRMHAEEMSAHLSLARAYEWTDDTASGLRQCEEAEKLAKVAHGVKAEMIIQSYRGTILAKLGKVREASRLAHVIEDYARSNSFETALLMDLYARLGDTAKVMSLANSALAAGDSNVLLCATNPYLDSMRDMPEYRVFLHKLGFAPNIVATFG